MAHNPGEAASEPTPAKLAVYPSRPVASDESDGMGQEAHSIS